jgi:hypothetical protein
MLPTPTREKGQREENLLVALSLFDSSSFLSSSLFFDVQTHQEREGLIGSGADGLVDGGLDLFVETVG